MTDEPLSAYVRRTGCDESSRGWIADRIAELESEPRSLPVPVVDSQIGSDRERAAYVQGFADGHRATTAALAFRGTTP